jgi:benzil reductase ((S)-benzoin forming)
MIVITGGGSGIGQALAQRLAYRGKEVLIIGRHTDTLLETANLSPHISTCTADISCDIGRQKILSHLETTLHIEALVHNAGIIEPIVPIDQLDEVSLQQSFVTNIIAPLLLTQALLAKLTHSRVLHIGSAVAYFPVAGWTAYCVSKAALAMLTRCWQLECLDTAFSSVMPGIVDTNMQSFIRQSHAMAPAQLNFYHTLKKEQRLLTPQTVALFLSWLLLDSAFDEYRAQEWDIYDTKHHTSWLVEPFIVPDFNFSSK